MIRIIAFVAVFMAPVALAFNITNLLSPDGLLRVEISADSGITFSVYADDNLLLKDASLM